MIIAAIVAGIFVFICVMLRLFTVKLKKRFFRLRKKVGSWDKATLKDNCMCRCSTCVQRKCKPDLTKSNLDRKQSFAINV